MVNWSELRIRAVRRWAPPLLALALLAIPVSLGTALAATQTFYLRSTGVPFSVLSEDHPTATNLPNFDPGRDNEPGLLLQRSSDEHNETDPDKYQLWMSAATGTELDGQVTLTFWSAMKDFNTTKKGSVRVQLFDCDLFFFNCDLLASTTKTHNPWSGGSGDWVQHSADLGYVEHNVPFGRSLAVKLVVRQVADDDMWIAYDTVSYPSSLSIETGPPPTTTTTTTLPPPTTTTTTVPPTTTTTSAPPTTTTTTTAPPATTTTTVPPPTTTTTPPTVPPPTTTTQPVYATTTTLPSSTGPPQLPTTTTTTTSPATTATTAPPTTTAAPLPTTTLPPTTTSTPPSAPAAPEDAETDTEDIALAALLEPDDADRGGARPGGEFSSALIDGLALVIPPAAAAALLSPLLLLEALMATFAGTGKELLAPLVILVVGVAWIGGMHRRKPTPAFVPWYERTNHE